MALQDNSPLVKLLTKLVDDKNTVALKHKTLANEYPEVLTISQVAKFLQVGNNKAYEIAAQDNFPVFKIGRGIRVLRSSLLEWVNNQQRFHGLQATKSRR